MNESFIFELLSSEKALGWQEVFLSLGISFVFGIIISQVYKKISKNSFYENDFGLTLIIVTIIVNSIMLTIGSNIALSLGLIGSLSIIRFRTAIKGSTDMSFLFWSIATGLAIGASQHVVAIVCSVIVITVLFLVNKAGFLNSLKNNYIAIINTKSAVKKNLIYEVFDKNGLKWELKSGFSDKEGLEITYSIQMKKSQIVDNLIEEIKSIREVESVSILSTESNVQI